MKKILMSTAALVGLAFVAAAPARAEDPALQLGVGGYINGYAVYTDQDGANLRKFDFRKQAKIHLNGEVALDNGITAGAYFQLLADRSEGASTIEESYLYLSSNWGRINLGEEDGIAYLIQVAPPMVDAEVDGPRPDIGTFTAANGGTLRYDQAPFAYTNKFTYITPSFNGFQAGFSYTPSPSAGDLAGTAASVTSNTAGDLKNGWEVAGRYEGSFDAVDAAIGAGYSKATRNSGRDLKDWNVGTSFGFGGFGLGAAYVNFDQNAAADTKTTGWVFGGDYVTGPYKLGLNYTTVNVGNGTGLKKTGVDRWTAGAIYEWGPGMTFRGAVQYQKANDFGGVPTADNKGTQVTLGTQLEF